MIDGLPTWVDGRDSGGHYTTTDAGANQYGIAVGQIMGYLNNDPTLPDVCNFIELSNEPNQKVTSGTPHATAIPPEDYGRMAAYATHWADYCGGQKSDGTPKRNVLAGALAIRGGRASFVNDWLPEEYAASMRDAINTYLYLLNPTNATKRGILQAAWRGSFHPYANLGNNQNGFAYTDPLNPSDDNTAAEGSATVMDTYLSRLRPVFGTTRKLWFTETGISSNKIGASEHATFHAAVWFGVASYPQVEGVINFGFTDLDPLMTSPTGLYYKLGVVEASDGKTYKPAGNTLKGIWDAWI